MIVCFDSKYELILNILKGIRVLLFFWVESEEI